MQKTGKVKLPPGKKVAVNLGCDFDAQSIWDGSYNLLSPAYMSRGEFGAEVGAPRLLALFKKYDIKTSWFIPGHTADTFPDICKEVLAAGHEIGCHGYVHENPTKSTYEQETKVLQMALESLDKLGAPKPVTYRSPYWDFSPNTIRILEENGFLYDSSMMGNDLHPYYPRPVTPHSDHANEFGEPSKILELPVSWFLDDFPQTEYLTGGQEGRLHPGRRLLHSDHPPADHWPGPHDPDVREADQLHGRAGRLVRHSGRDRRQLYPGLV